MRRESAILLYAVLNVVFWIITAITWHTDEMFPGERWGTTLCGLGIGVTLVGAINLYFKDQAAAKAAEK